MLKPLTRPQIVIVVCALIVVVLLAVFMYKRQSGSGGTPSPSPTAEISPVSTSSPSLSPSASPSFTSTLTPSPSSSVSPSLTPTFVPTPSSTFSDSAQHFVDGFYVSYTARRTDQLAADFTPDTTTNDQFYHSTLFKGVDPSGVPGGPTLFETSSASQGIKSYTIVGKVQQGTNWVVTVNEQRLDESGQAAGQKVTVMTLVSSGNSWLISSYIYQGGSGKYGAFLLQ